MGYASMTVETTNNGNAKMDNSANGVWGMETTENITIEESRAWSFESFVTII